MDQRISMWIVLIVVVAVFAATGCSAGQRQSVDAALPSFRADKIAQQAMSNYDRNADARLTADELAACPGIAANLGLYDADSDGAVTAAEISTRVKRWIEGGSGLLYVRSVVALNGTPLPEAVVEFEPEPFLNDVLATASGVSGPDGSVAVVPQGCEIPELLRGRPVMQPGLYKVRITHPKVAIPARYNRETELGCEVSQETADPSKELVFRLQSKTKRAS